MKFHRHNPESGSLILMVMCLLAVLGIALASYLQLSNQAMKLSNRAYAKDVSVQLAEMGLERALRSFNANTFSSWTHPDATTSTRTLNSSNTPSIASSNYGNSGITASVNVRVDNYNAGQLDTSNWNSSYTYQTNDLVCYGTDGIWYRSLKDNNTGNAPLGALSYSNLTYWAPAPIPWRWCANTAYTADYDVVCYGGVWYRCTASHTSSTTFNASNWTTMPAPVLAVITNTFYAAGTFAFRVGDSTWYRCLVDHTIGSSWDATEATKWSSSTAPYISWAYRSTVTYSYNDVVFYSGTPGVAGTWYRCKVASSLNVLPTSTTPANWENALSGTNSTSSPGVNGWSSSSINYNAGDIVYYSGTSKWYRCIAAHTSSATVTPTNTAYWSNSPLYSTVWDSGRQYSANDTVRYNGVWYLSLQNSNKGRNPVAATTYWIGADTSNTSYTWNASTSYSVGNYRCYGGVWYQCLSAGANKSPNNSSYWTASWANSWGVTTGAPVIYSEGRVLLPDGTSTITTQLRATVAPAPLFPNAAAATATIGANSGGTVDSYDSTTGTVAVQPGVTGTAGTSNAISGTYGSQQNTSTNYSAVLASNYTAGTAITLTTTNVKGYLAAPSSSGAPRVSSGGSVKSMTSPGSPSIDLSRLSRTPFIPQFDTVPGGTNGLATNWATTPKGAALVLATTTTLGTPGAITPSRYYINSSLTIGGASIQYLKIIGPVVLYINGDLFITQSSSTGRIDISSTGSAEIHIAGRFMADAIGEGIQNYTGDPKSVIIICDTNSTSTHFYSEGVNDLYGVIYVPYSTSTTGYYNDNNATEIFGAVSANKITYSGANLNIHYDTSLRYATFGGVDQPWAVSEWRELTDPAEQVTLP